MILVLPLLSALVYVAGALFLKRAAELGAGTWRIAWACNLTTAILFLPLVLLGGVLPQWQQFSQPAIVALLFVLGQVFTFHSLQVGDVSVATPVLGIKIILVALFTTALLGESLTSSLWAAALLSSIAIVLLNLTQGSHRRVGFTIILASSAAASYALFDVLVQQWSPAWGAGRFLPVTMGFVALFSVPMRALAQSRGSTSDSRFWVLGGAICFAVQAIMFVSTIALSGEATAANVLYSSRGLWSVLAVWLVGHWFSSGEQRVGSRVFAWRLCGAALLMTAIVIAVIGRRNAGHVTDPMGRHHAEALARGSVFR
jgi:drug/metabolite transporter (DMT)-like permease